MSEIVDSGHKNSKFSQTVNLLSHHLKENRSRNLGMGRNESGPMTIFYKGQVIVLDEFPAEKAMEIMMLAARGTPKQEQPLPVVSDLPMARKASLARFLEKRKERITARAAYYKNESPSFKA